MLVLKKFLFLKERSTKYEKILDKMKDFVDTELLINSQLDSACCSRTQAEI